MNQVIQAEKTSSVIFSRVKKKIDLTSKKVFQASSGCSNDKGCTTDKGCCADKGCCSDKGCCADKGCCSPKYIGDPD